VAKRGDGLLSHADYDAIGGVEGALANRAEETFGHLQPVEQDEFDRVMRAVTTADDNETFTRRWADRDELGRVPATKAFINAFLAPEARLFVVDRNLAGRVVVSVTHEALRSTALINQGDVFTDQGDLAAALKCYEESLAIRQNLFQQNSQSTESQRDVATALSKIAGNRHAQN
jgi:Novel STAND NTPase 1